MSKYERRLAATTAILALLMGATAAAQRDPTIAQGFADGQEIVDVAASPGDGAWVTLGAGPGPVDETSAGAPAASGAGAPAASGSGSAGPAPGAAQNTSPDYPPGRSPAENDGDADATATAAVSRSDTSPAVAHVSAGGEVIVVDLPSWSRPRGVVAAPDSTAWVADASGAIVRVTLDGQVTRFDAGVGRAEGISIGPDGAVWFTEVQDPARVGRLDPATGAVRAWRLPTGDARPTSIAGGSDGALWFTESGAGGAIGRVTIDGEITEYRAGLLDGSMPLGIAAGPGGALWFADARGAVGRVTVDGGIDEFPLPGAAPVDVAASPDGSVWIAQHGVEGVARMRSSGALRTTALPLPDGFHPRGVAASAGALWISASGAPSRLRGIPTKTGDAGRLPATVIDLSHAPQPELGRAIAVGLVAGRVLVQTPGRAHSRVLSASTRLPTGSVVDARRGTVELRSAVDAEGHVQTGTFWGGLFRISQDARTGMTRLALREAPRGCRTSATAHAARRRRPPRLWGKDSRGRFQTVGRGSAATVRGTQWLTEERCAGTFTRVMQGAVDVHERRTGRTFRVSAGHSHLARVPR